MSEPPVPTGVGRGVGTARSAYRRLKSAAGVSDLAALEEHVDRLESALAESAALSGPLVSLVDRIEGMLVPVLQSRVDRPAPPDGPTPDP